MASLPQWPYFTYPPAEARKANPLRLGGALLAETRRPTKAGVLCGLV